MNNKSTILTNSSSTLQESQPLIIALNVPYIAAEVVIAFLAMLGNTLVCIAVLHNNKLWTVTNYFLASLAIADICVGAVAIPCAILANVGLPRDNVHLCLFMLSVLIMLTLSSTFSLLAVAVERYVAVFFPLRYRRIMTHQTALAVIIVTWIISFLIGLLPMMGWHKPTPKKAKCFFTSLVDMNYMVYFNFFACFLVPLFIMLVIYAQIFFAVKQQIRRIAVDTAHCSLRHRKATSMRQEMKTATSLFLVLFLFVICWIPLHILNTLYLLRPDLFIPLPLQQAAIILTHANSAINPIFYAYKMKSFQHTFKTLFSRGSNVVAPGLRQDSPAYINIH